ncbi:methylglyoxal synthase [Roseomonas hellenica]|uniref:Methylglyoxal synthase n=2 Tax=Plastoroseomonas hellenica TaxID=2687306 RepID=A0ABS5F9L3_9PROT|nr:methylglyoxal synthase [Plastoroseomonas hellenica]MBR0669241.1 methylglyoxal synthase [Plastoroseomonas hellenica]
MQTRRRIALIAHDAKKATLTAWARRWEGWLAHQYLVGTGSSAEEVGKACPSLRIERLRSGPEGGDMQVGARIVDGEIDALVFLPDPANAHPHEADFRALIRIALIADIPIALSAASAEHLAIGMSQALPTTSEPVLQDIYVSSNGDRWRLGTAAHRRFVRHEPNQASGGSVTDTDLDHFLGNAGPGPEHVALRRILEVRSDGGA